MSQLLLFFLFMMSLGPLAQARLHPGDGSRLGPISSSSSESSFYFSLGAKALYGTMASGDSTTVESRHLMDYAAETVIGVKWDSFIFGAGADYGMWKQMTNPSDVSNSNTQGKQTNISLDIGYDFGPLILLGKYELSSDYKVDKADALGNKVSYGGAKTPFAVQVLFKAFGGGSHVGLEYSSIIYAKQTSNGVTGNLTSQTQIKTSAVGVVYAWIF